MMHLAFDVVSACASVLATINSTPCSPDVIMLLTALPPAPPTPNTTMRAFISRISVMSVILPHDFSAELGMRGHDCDLSCLRMIFSDNRRPLVRIMRERPCGLPPPGPRRDALVGARPGYRSGQQPVRWTAEILRAAPLPPWPPWSRQSPAAPRPSADR